MRNTPPSPSWRSCLRLILSVFLFIAWVAVTYVISSRAVTLVDAASFAGYNPPDLHGLLQTCTISAQFATIASGFFVSMAILFKNRRKTLLIIGFILFTLGFSALVVLTAKFGLIRSVIMGASA